jgi:hypothetical protein
MRKFTRRLLLVFSCGLLSSFLFAQVAVPAQPQAMAPLERENLKFNLNADGSRYFQATFLNQTWLRFNESNPGTTVLAKSAPNTFDIGLRRTRIQLFGQLTKRTFIYLQFGQNNFNYLSATAGNRKVAAFFHDAVGEYKVTKNDGLKLGAGLTIANGLSRFSQPSVGTIMTMDVPVFAQATVDQTDEFSRKLSVYARGQVGHLDYRVVLSDPFPIQTNGSTPPAIATHANFAQQGHSKQFQGLLQWQFFDKDAHTTPYATGTYLGKKKMLNVSVGAIYQPDAMWRLSTSNDTVYDPMLLLCGDVFLDMPLNKETGTAVSAYAGYYHLDYGPDYLRYNGIMNPANGTTATNAVTGVGPTFGNAFPMFGTGSTIYAQAGYKFKNDLLGEGRGTLMPYAAWTHSNYDRIGSAVDVMNLGVNWLISGHGSKVSLDYQNRPTFGLDGTGAFLKGSRKGQLVLQYQVFI